MTYCPVFIYLFVCLFCAGLLYRQITWLNFFSWCERDAKEIFLQVQLQC